MNRKKWQERIRAKSANPGTLLLRLLLLLIGFIDAFFYPIRIIYVIHDDSEFYDIYNTMNRHKIKITSFYY